MLIIEDRCESCETVLHRWTGPDEHRDNAVPHVPVCRGDEGRCGGNVVRTETKVPD